MIRRYDPTSDYEEVVEIFKLNTPVHFDPEELPNFENYLDTNNNNYFVIEESGVIKGCGGYHIMNNNDVARLSWDIIHPDYHGEGKGSELVNFILNLISEDEDVSSIEVWTSQVANSFYYKFGFRSIEMVKDYWAVGFDLYRMQIDLKKV
ncbi:GNAT family N-acetyltransferase [Mangrovivirga sp. M17]|uniref:GNAT family N-acetyltransferase n=1 Tax=Mangrovivirga halotolerans TaxID=2993936 RepID=A0ABT3RP18_9BACT|nr:GNAT family N-acetyltransferase [Mangrovivirga halotolerans]MCX2743002.1 GNAT family N-acetyltransferase [Mangrovivirga halotolerans]